MKNFSFAETFAPPTANLTNLANSIIAHFGVKPFHKTIPEIDKLLKGRKKVAVFLFDGMGEYILCHHQQAGRLFLENEYLIIDSTNPATTVAATTSFLTAKSPIETGWLGWALPVLGIEEPIEVFPGTSFLTGEKLGRGIMEREFPVTYIDELINNAGHKAKILYQYGVGGRTDGPADYLDAPPMAKKYFEEGGEFLYVYFNTPDGLIHHNGVDAQIVDDRIALAAKTVETFARENPDVLTLCIADHGLLDVKYFDLKDYPEFKECLRAPMCLEARTTNFYVKKEKEQEFLDLMKSKFPQFRVISRDFAISSHYFGEGETTEKIKNLLGDYIALAQDNTCFIDTSCISTQCCMAAHHAGPLKEEKRILVSAFNKTINE